MRFAKNTLIPLLVLAQLAVACASNQIPDIRICKEIPFVDAPEGACIWTVSHKQELVSAADWAKARPYQLTLDDKDWIKIKETWLKMCRLEGNQCNVQVDSIDKVIKAIDALAQKIIAP